MGNLPEAVGPENRPVVPAVRASDADRERVAVALQAAFAEGRLTMPELEERLAAAYAAGTDAELATVMHDLRASAPQPGDWAGAAPTSVRDVGIIAGFRRKGRWMVGRTFRGLAVIGNGEIDLRQARFIDGETTIHATAIIGNITVVVPEDADVHIETSLRALSRSAADFLRSGFRRRGSAGWGGGP